jgi:hypothetical protein
MGSLVAIRPTRGFPSRGPSTSRLPRPWADRRGPLASAHLHAAQFTGMRALVSVTLTRGAALAEAFLPAELA